ncbi:Rpn family recombination-promoting nuclease/putative transposase [Bacillus cereus]|nr:Rpn family recombination-promoting nuclease/putative transposase [Bacillus cereus]
MPPNQKIYVIIPTLYPLRNFAIEPKHDMQKRSLYYWSKLYTSQMQEGMAYRELQKAITINVLDFVLYPKHENFQTMGRL